MFADIEQQLADHLRQRLPADVAVETAADLEGVTESRLRTPAVHLVYQNYRVSQNRPDGKVSRIEQIWLAIVVTKNVRSVGSGQDARSESMTLADQVASQLMGQHLPGSTGPIQLSNPPNPSYSSGFSWLPVAFSVQTKMEAAKP